MRIISYYCDFCGDPIDNPPFRDDHPIFCGDGCRQKWEEEQEETP